MDRLPGVDRVLARQLLRSATSIGANVEEAQAAQSRADFISKFSIALKAAREIRYWLRLTEASGTLPDQAVRGVLNEVDEISRILGKSIVTAKRNNERS